MNLKNAIVKKTLIVNYASSCIKKFHKEFYEKCIKIHARKSLADGGVGGVAQALGGMDIYAGWGVFMQKYFSFSL